MLNKILFGTTAATALLLSAGAQAADDGLVLKVNGFFQGYFQVGSFDDSAANGFGNLRSTTLDTWNSEIWFTAEATAANGLKYGFRVELEGYSTSDQIDESYLYLTGGFGSLKLGNDDGVGNNLAYFIPTPTRSGAIGIEDGNYIPNAPAGGHTLAAFNSPNHYSGDASKIIYTTPAFSGFTFGISYAPELCEDNVGAAACNNGGFETDDTLNQAGDALELGVKYANKFGDLGVNASFTYYQDKLEAQGVAPTRDDRKSYAVGGGIAIKGLSLGLNYMHTDNYSAQSYTAAGIDGAKLDQVLVGVQYVTGPWSVGANYGWGSVEDAAGTAGREDELQAGLVGVGYNVAPGLELDAGVQYFDWSSNAASREGSALVGLVGTTLKF